MATTTNTNTTTATTSSTTTPPPPPLPPPPTVDTATTTTATAEEVAAKTVQKRYEGLVMVRTKAIKGKGAWYWQHLEPMLALNTETGLPKAVKLRCSLCEAVFSASNPSRTASEHLKRGTCPNFSSNTSKAMMSSSSTPPHASVVVASSPTSSNRKRSASSSSSLSPYPLNALPPVGSTPVVSSTQIVGPLSIVDPLRFSGDVAVTPHHHYHHHHHHQQQHHHHQQQQQQQHQQLLVLSGGKDDLGALALLEDSVKKLKSPKTSPGPALSKTQVESALELLADWVYESCG